MWSAGEAIESATLDETRQKAQVSGASGPSGASWPESGRMLIPCAVQIIRNGSTTCDGKSSAAKAWAMGANTENTMAMSASFAAALRRDFRISSIVVIGIATHLPPPGDRPRNQLG